MGDIGASKRSATLEISRQRGDRVVFALSVAEVVAACGFGGDGEGEGLAVTASLSACLGCSVVKLLPGCWLADHGCLCVTNRATSVYSTSWELRSSTYVRVGKHSCLRVLMVASLPVLKPGGQHKWGSYPSLFTQLLTRSVCRAPPNRRHIHMLPITTNYKTL